MCFTFSQQILMETSARRSHHRPENSSPAEMMSNGRLKLTEMKKSLEWDYDEETLPAAFGRDAEVTSDSSLLFNPMWPNTLQDFMCFFFVLFFFYMWIRLIAGAISERKKCECSFRSRSSQLWTQSHFQSDKRDNDLIPDTAGAPPIDCFCFCTRANTQRKLWFLEVNLLPPVLGSDSVTLATNSELKLSFFWVSPLSQWLISLPGTENSKVYLISALAKSGFPLKLLCETGHGSELGCCNLISQVL